ncbi:MAG TPA: DNA polymerase III subunit gamma/tau [Steroidobacteraceae bacterium]|jgi:DNA polymerase-3 subunit gamma/tau|nr:DNA polymerase III subunit gamma/tau [Steroidobacteraceae bacterium]
MSYIVLARKWRPKRFSEMVGQEHVLKALANALDSGKVHHAFLFTGTRGVGKTTIARILAKSLNCETNGVSATPCGTCAACREIDEGRFIDLIEVDAASRTKVDDTRDLLDNVQYAPSRGRYKVYLIDEAHMLSNHSFNALLKTLEEPPPHVKFMLATTDPQKVPVTVLSRCLQFSLQRLPAALIGERLKFIAREEKLEFEPAALALVARAAEGSMRDSLSLLDQLIAFGGGTLTEANARAMLGTIDRGHITRLVEALARMDGPALLAEVAELDRNVPDYDRALIDLAAFLQRLAIVQIVPDAAPMDEDYDAEALTRLAQAVAPEDLQLYYQIALGGRRDLSMAPDPRAGFEMTLLRMLAFRPDGAPAQDAESPKRTSPAAPRAVAGGGADVAGRGAGVAGGGAGTPVSKPAAAAAAAAPGARAGGTPSSMASPPRGAPAGIEPGNWPAIVEAAGLSGMVRQFALNCTPASFEKGALALKMDPPTADRRTRPIEDRLAQALSKLMGQDIRVTYEVVSSDLETPARQRALAEIDRLERAATAFEQDPTVKGLRERFGADVDLASVKPVN